MFEQAARGVVVNLIMQSFSRKAQLRRGVTSFIRQQVEYKARAKSHEDASYGIDPYPGSLIDRDVVDLKDQGLHLQR